jgi:hypothetical protein
MTLGVSSIKLSQVPVPAGRVDYTWLIAGGCTDCKVFWTLMLEGQPEIGGFRLDPSPDGAREKKVREATETEVRDAIKSDVWRLLQLNRDFGFISDRTEARGCTELYGH